jgi:hypothetical protein
VLEHVVVRRLGQEKQGASNTNRLKAAELDDILR